MTATVEEIQEQLSELFGDDIRHIEGNLYKVKRSIIVLPEPFDSDSKVFKAGNPRWFLTEDGKMIAKGLHGTDKDAKESQELRDSIRNEGMEHPIRLRFLENELVGVNGERRLRACSELEKNDEKCFDQDLGKFRDAKDVVGWIQARISVMTEEEAMKKAVEGNETSVPIGHAATVNIVKGYNQLYQDQAESKGMSGKRADKWIKSKIKQQMGKSDAWIDDTMKMVNLDNDTLIALHQEKIDRQVAINLSEISNLDERLERLNDVCNIMSTFIQRKKEKLKSDIENFEDKIEIQEAKAVEEEIVGEDSTETKEAIESTKTKIEEKEEQAEGLEENPPAATNRQLKEAEQKAKKKHGADKVTTTRKSTLSYSKRNKYWSAQADELIENDEDLADYAQLVKLLLELEGQDARDSENEKLPISLKAVLAKHNST